MKILSIFLIAFAITQTSTAQPLYFGLKVQQSNPLTPSGFKDNADVGAGAGLLLGYRWTEQWAVELGADQFNFGKLEMNHTAFQVNAAYRPWTGLVSPYIRAGAGFGENKFDTAGTDKKSGLAGNVGGGVEFNFKPATLFAGLSWQYLGKINDDVKSAQSINVQIGVIFPGVGGNEVVKSEHKAETVPVVAAQPEPVAPKPTEDFVTKCLNSDAPECKAAGNATVKINVEFLPGKSNITSEYEAEIERLGKYLAKYPQTNVEVAGHTDNTGSAKMNTLISQKRAAAVKEMLIKKHSIAAARITAKGYGPSKPLGPNTTPDDRAKNRRVEANITINK